MLSKLLLGLSVMAACVLIHSMGMISVVRSLRGESVPATFSASVWRLIRIAAWTVMLHLCQIVGWALVYRAGEAMPDFATAAYFSAVTYTTTGYGDLVLPAEWRLVGGIEALTGILMCGLSTGMFVAVFAEIFGLKRRNAPASP